MNVTPAKNPAERPAESSIAQATTDARSDEKNIFVDTRRNEPRGNNDPRVGKQQKNNQPRRDKRDIHGWVVLDKPIGMTSKQAVADVKRLLSAKRAGHEYSLLVGALRLGRFGARHFPRSELHIRSSYRHMRLPGALQARFA
jgi:hypothetical protein